MLFWLNPFHTGHKLILGFAVSLPNLLQTYGGCSIRLVNQMQTCAKHRANLLIPGGQPRQRRLRPAEEAGLSPAARRGTLGHSGVVPPWRRGCRGRRGPEPRDRQTPRAWACATATTLSCGCRSPSSKMSPSLTPASSSTRRRTRLEAEGDSPAGASPPTTGLVKVCKLDTMIKTSLFMVWYVCSRFGKFVQGLVCLFKVW